MTYSVPTDRGQLHFAEEWTSVFSTVHVETCGRENVPFWAKPGPLPTTAPEIPLPTTAAEIVTALMRDLCEDSNAYLYQAVEVEGFCSPADLDVLKTGRDPRVTRPVALLDDRNEGGARDNPRGTVRPNKGALTAHQLYTELRKMVRSQTILSFHYVPAKTNIQSAIAVARGLRVLFTMDTCPPRQMKPTQTGG